MSGPLARVLGLNARNREIMAGSSARSRRRVTDKVATKQVLLAAGLPVPPTIAVITHRRDIRPDHLVRSDGTCLKPANGSRGQGIRLLRPGAATSGPAWDVVVDHAERVLAGEFSRRNRDHLLVEPLLEPDPDLRPVAPDGLPDLRVIVRSGRPIAAMLRLPTAESDGRANLHAGGIGAAVDLHSGRLVAAARRRRPLTHHPDTGAAIVGRVVRDIAAAGDLAVRAASRCSLGLAGIDIVDDHRLGLLVLEVNAWPGLEIQNVTGIGLAA